MSHVLADANRDLTDRYAKALRAVADVEWAGNRWNSMPRPALCPCCGGAFDEKDHEQGHVMVSGIRGSHPCLIAEALRKPSRPL